jgi:diaminopimelate epimerase
VKIWFTKMSGAGNDFVVIDNRSRRIRNGSRIARLMCDRRWGVGADGLLLLERSRKADYRMMYYNADGSYGGMCGNGGRCIARFAVLGGIAPQRHRFEALGHVYAADVIGQQVALNMKDPRKLILEKHLLLDGKRISISYVDTGSPHAVVPCKSFGQHAKVKSTEVPTLGRKIRFHSAFQPSGTNANFIERGSGNSLFMRTYERGVEAETMACGTGSIASAIVASRLWKLKSPVAVIQHSGKTLKVEFKDDGKQFSSVRLIGPATISFQGVFEA